MAYDIDAAKKAGYSDEEIASYLAEKYDYDMSGALNAGWSFYGDVLPYLIEKDANRETTWGELGKGAAISTFGQGAVRAAQVPANVASWLSRQIDPMDTAGITSFLEPNLQYYEQIHQQLQEAKPEAYRRQVEQYPSFLDSEGNFLKRDEEGNVTGFNTPSAEALIDFIGPSMLESLWFAVPGAGIERALARGAKARSFFVAHPNVARAVGYGTTNAMIVAPQEWRSTYQEAIAAGHTEQEAKEMADASSLISFGVSSLTGGAGGALAGKLGAASTTIPRAVAKGVIAEAPFEGVEEFGQSLGRDIGMGRPLEYKQALDQLLVGTVSGGIPGGVIGGVGNLAQRQVAGLSTPEIELERLARDAERRYMDRIARELPDAPPAPSNLPVPYTPPIATPSANPVQAAARAAATIQQTLGSNFPLTKFVAEESKTKPGYFVVRDETGGQHGPEMAQQEAGILASMLTEAAADRIVENDIDLSVNRAQADGNVTYSPMQRMALSLLGRRIFHPRENTFTADQINKAAGKPVAQEARTYTIAEARELLGEQAGNLINYVPATIGGATRADYVPFKGKAVKGAPRQKQGKGLEKFRAVKDDTGHGIQSTFTGETIYTGFDPQTGQRKPFETAKAANEYAASLNNRIKLGETVYRGEISEPGTVTQEKLEDLLRSKNIFSNPENQEVNLQSPEFAPIIRAVTGQENTGKLNQQDLQLLHDRLRSMPIFDKPTKLPDFQSREYTPDQYRVASQMAAMTAAEQQEGVQFNQSIPPRAELEQRVGVLSDGAYEQLAYDLKNDKRWKDVAKDRRRTDRDWREAENKAKALRQREMDSVLRAVRNNLDSMRLNGVRSTMVDYLRFAARGPDGETILGAQRPEAKTSRAAYQRSMNEVFVALDSLKQQPEYQAVVNESEEVRIQVLTDLALDSLNHEVVHALRQADLFTKGEWDILTKLTRQQQRPESWTDAEGNEVNGTYLDWANDFYPDLNPVKQQEEAIAEMIRDGLRGKLALGGKPRNIFQKVMDFIRGIVGLQERNGYKSFDEILEGITSGEIGGRPTVDAEGKPVVRTTRLLQDPDLALMLDDQAVADLAEQKAYHGSGAKWTRPDLSYVGTGEGAQAYGWGFYVADVPGTAKTYIRPANLAFQALHDENVGNAMDVDSTIAALESYKSPDDAPIAYRLMNYKKAAQWLRDNAEDLRNDPGGYLYEVDIPDSAIAKMLDWDKPLSEQAESVRRVLENHPLIQERRKTAVEARQRMIDQYEKKGYIGALPPRGATPELHQKAVQRHADRYRAAKQKWNPTGEGIYRILSQKLSSHEKAGITPEGDDQKAASEFLNSLGIPGIKYLDAASRPTGKAAARAPQGLIKPLIDAARGKAERAPTRNYVLFDEKYVKPLTRNGQPIDVAEQRGEARKLAAEDAKWRKWEPELTADGKIKFAPEWVENRKDFFTLVGLFRKFVKEGEAGRYWYERSSKAIMDLVQNDVIEAEKLIQLVAIYSQNTNVWVNTLNAIKGWTQWKQGVPRDQFHVAMPEQDAKAVGVLYDNQPFDGRKINSFYTNLMHDIVASNPEVLDTLQLPRDVVNEIDKAVTVDVWMLRAAGYKRAVASDAIQGRYGFVENLSRRIAAELNAKLGPNEERWTPHQVQAAIWTSMKSRYELPDVMRRTNKKSLKEGLIRRESVPQGNGRSRMQMTYPREGTDNWVKHQKNWRDEALKPTSAEIAVAARENGRDFADDIARLGSKVTAEAIPSGSLGLDINNASPETKAEFTRRAHEILTRQVNLPAGGVGVINELAEKIGIALTSSKASSGAYKQSINPNIIDTLIPPKGAGAFPRKLVRLYATALQYIFKQDAVPWFRPDNKLAFEREGGVSNVLADQQKFRLINKNGNTVPGSKRDRLEDVIALRDSRDQGDTIQGGPFALGVALQFNDVLSVDKQKRIIELLSQDEFFGRDAGFTVMDDGRVAIINFRGDQDGVPFARSDDEFTAVIDRFSDQHGEELGLDEAQRFWSEGEYGYEHNWQEDPDGSAIMARLTEQRPDLHEWIQDRAQAFEGLLGEYSGDIAYQRSAAPGPAESVLRPGGRVLEESEGLVLSGKKAPGASTVTGVHYGNEPTETLEGNRFGSGIRGAEQARLSNASDPRILRRVYFYVPRDFSAMERTDPYMAGKLAQDVPRPEPGLGPNVVMQKFANVLDGDSPVANRFKNMDPNEFESAIIDAGYDGYYAPSQGVMVILNYDVPVKPLGTSPELEAQNIPAQRNREAVFDMAFQRGDVYEGFTTEPNQIKSATGNRGTYDPTKADIGEQRTTPRQPTASEKFWNTELDRAGIQDREIRAIFKKLPPRKIPTNLLIERAAAFELARKRFLEGKKSEIWSTVLDGRKPIDEELMAKAVNMLRRHQNTIYDELLRQGVDRNVARRLIADFMTQRGNNPQGYIAPRTTLRNLEPNEIGGYLKKWWNRNFRAINNLPEAAFEAKTLADAAKRTENFDVDHLLIDFRRAVQKAYGLRLWEDYNSLPEATRIAMNEFLADTSNNTHGLPAEVLPPLRAMRAHIDRLSSRMIADGVVDGDVVQTVLDNQGHYLHRSYRAFDDPNWDTKVPPQVLRDAINFLTQEARNTGLINGKPTPTDPNELARQVNFLINNILTEGKAAGSIGAFFGTDKLGRQDLRMLKKRGDIAPEIRALMGEYRDAVVNFTKTANLMGYAIANHRLLQTIYDEGYGNWLFEAHEAPPQFSVPISTKNSYNYGPIAGLYTTPEIARAFVDVMDPKIISDFYRNILMVNGMVKYGKTVLSVTTMMRNFISAFMFSMANGHVFSNDFFENIHLAARTLANELAGTDKELTPAQISRVLRQGTKGREYYKKLTRLGVTLDNPYPGEMMAAMHDAMNPSKMGGAARQRTRRFFGFFTKLYQYGDDFWKIVGFESEKAALMRSGMSLQEAEVEAAKRIRNTYPTYSLIGKQIKRVRRTPLMGTFVSFPAEIVRTSTNIMRMIADDYTSGRKELAARRLLGATFAAGWASAASALTMALVGLDDEDDEAVRKMAAPWQRNSDLFYVGYDDDGMLQYFDLSFSDPYNYLKRPINALFMGGDWKENMFAGVNPFSGFRKGSGLRDMLDPFFGPDIAFTALTEIFTNSRIDGSGYVYNPMSSGPEQMAAISDHLWKAVRPGTALNFERMVKAVTGDVSRGGTQYTVEDELFALAGFRRSTMNFGQSLKYKTYELKEDTSRAARLLSYPLGGQNKVDRDEIEDAFEQMIVARTRRYQEMIQLLEMIKDKEKGMTRAEIIKVMDSAGLSRKEAIQLVNGRIPRWKPSSTFLQRAMQSAINTAPRSRRDEVRQQFRERRKIVYELMREYNQQK